MKEKPSSKEPLFSVLMANFNNGQYIAKAIESVLAQTYSNWELIIVDDGSTDSSGSYLKKIENEKIKIHFNKKNFGCGYTKNKCVSLSSGEICGFLDPDDTIAPQAISRMVKEHIDNPDHSIIYSTHFLCDDQLRVKKMATYVDQIQNGESHLTLSDKGISHFSTFKKRNYSKTEGISKSLQKAVDQDLYYKLEETGPTKFIPEPLYFYRQHKNGISSFENTPKAYLANLVAMRNAYKRRKRNPSQFAPNITKKDLYSRHYTLYSEQALRMGLQKKWVSMALYIFSGLRFSQKTSDLLVLRFFLLPLGKLYPVMKSVLLNLTSNKNK